MSLFTKNNFLHTRYNGLVFLDQAVNYPSLEVSFGETWKKVNVKNIGNSSDLNKKIYRVISRFGAYTDLSEDSCFENKLGNLSYVSDFVNGNYKPTSDSYKIFKTSIYIPDTIIPSNKNIIIQKGDHPCDHVFSDFSCNPNTIYDFLLNISSYPLLQLSSYLSRILNISSFIFAKKDVGLFASIPCVNMSIARILYALFAYINVLSKIKISNKGLASLSKLDLLGKCSEILYSQPYLHINITKWHFIDMTYFDFHEYFLRGLFLKDIPKNIYIKYSGISQRITKVLSNTNRVTGSFLKMVNPIYSYLHVNRVYYVQELPYDLDLYKINVIDDTNENSNSKNVLISGLFWRP